MLRAIRADDKLRLAQAHGRLSPESARRRFLGPKPRLTTAELRYLTEVDGADHVALLAVLAHDPRCIVGVGRFVRWPDRPDAAEVAVVVGDAWQGQGLGRHMGLALADAARAHGIRRFTASMLADNRAAHRLFERISARLHAECHDGIEELVAELAA
ncbi:MAG: GCN5-related N-acetyltransferase [Solirubrobacterales bacterium]|nr:GCN5-related N-acetyltransferase [Solirubrobacterales bacterium]